MIIAAHHRDPEPIGGPEYKTLTHLLKLQGPEGYVSALRDPQWKFVKDQWEPEVWARALRRVGERGLIYCTTEIPRTDFTFLPGLSGYDFLTPDQEEERGAQMVGNMVQNALIWGTYRNREKGIHPSVVFIREGPYAVPTKR